MRIRDLLQSKGVDPALALYAERVFLQKSRERVYGKVGTERNSYLDSIFKPLGDDTFEGR